MANNIDYYNDCLEKIKQTNGLALKDVDIDKLTSEQYYNLCDKGLDYFYEKLYDNYYKLQEELKDFEGKYYSLEGCVEYGDPNPDIGWYLEGAEVDEDTVLDSIRARAEDKDPSFYIEEYKSFYEINHTIFDLVDEWGREIMEVKDEEFLIKYFNDSDYGKYIQFDVANLINFDKLNNEDFVKFLGLILHKNNYEKITQIDIDFLFKQFPPEQIIEKISSEINRTNGTIINEENVENIFSYLTYYDSINDTQKVFDILKNAILSFNQKLDEFINEEQLEKYLEYQKDVKLMRESGMSQADIMQMCNISYPDIEEYLKNEEQINQKIDNYLSNKNEIDNFVRKNDEIIIIEKINFHNFTNKQALELCKIALSNHSQNSAAGTNHVFQEINKYTLSSVNCYEISKYAMENHFITLRDINPNDFSYSPNDKLNRKDKYIEIAKIALSKRFNDFADLDVNFLFPDEYISKIEYKDELIKAKENYTQLYKLASDTYYNSRYFQYISYAPLLKDLAPNLLTNNEYINICLKGTNHINDNYKNYTNKEFIEMPVILHNFFEHKKEFFENIKPQFLNKDEYLRICHQTCFIINQRQIFYDDRIINPLTKIIFENKYNLPEKFHKMDLEEIKKYFFSKILDPKLKFVNLNTSEKLEKENEIEIVKKLKKENKPKQPNI